MQRMRPKIQVNILNYREKTHYFICYALKKTILLQFSYCYCDRGKNSNSFRIIYIQLFFNIYKTQKQLNVHFLQESTFRRQLSKFTTCEVSNTDRVL